jgi:hypothetical protein
VVRKYVERNSLEYVHRIILIGVFLEAQIRLVNYCCTLLHKSVLDDDEHVDDDDETHPHSHHHHHHHQQQQPQNQKDLNHLVYAEQHYIVHSLGYAILTFLSVVRCRKEIGTFYRENEHFRELLSAMRHKYGSRSEFLTRDPSIAHALNQMATIIFDRHQRRKKRHYSHHPPAAMSAGDVRKHPRHDPFAIDDNDNDENRAFRKCSNSLCQMIENDVSVLNSSKDHR